MKKWMAGLAAAVLFVSMGATTVFASDSWGGQAYQDADRDGVCDYRTGVSCWADADGDGVCDRCGLEGWGSGWVDADKDGVCDNYGQGRQGRGWRNSGGSPCRGAGCGRGMGCR